jgi:GNAT superfamily N-acetyltransferase
MITVKRTDSAHGDFAVLVKLLDAELAIRDGSEHSFYAQYNTIDRIKYVVLAYDGDTAVGCGAIKEYAPGTMEVKRMYVRPDWRQMGVATKILAELETWAKGLSAQKCILETGKKQPEAIGLYRRHGYVVIPNYGQYAGVENSVCFAKEL